MINKYKDTNNIIDIKKIGNEKIMSIIYTLLNNTKNKVIRILKLDVNGLFKKSITEINKKTDEIVLKIKNADLKTKLAIGGTLLLVPGGFVMTGVLGSKLAYDYVKSKNKK